MRMTEEYRDSLSPYEYGQEIELADGIADLCITKDQMDAAALCVFIMWQAAPQYNYVKAPYIKNMDRNRKHFEEAMAAATTPAEKETEIHYMQEMKPIEPQAQKIKRDAKQQSVQILKDAGMGKKRIDKILPRLIKILNDTGKPLTDVEVEFHQRDLERFLNKKK